LKAENGKLRVGSYDIEVGRSLEKLKAGGAFEGAKVGRREGFGSSELRWERLKVRRLSEKLKTEAERSTASQLSL
jgi:hypothetical protein